MPRYLRAREGTIYFFTVVTCRRQKILCNEDARSALRMVLNEAQQRYPFRIDALVLLPDHLHCTWDLPENDRNYSLRWGWIKKEFTKRVRSTITKEPDTVGTAHPTHSRVKHREWHIWQRRFWEHMIRDEHDYSLHCDYIHFNPVKHGLVKNPKEWPFSTFHRFVKEGVYEESWAGTEEIYQDLGGE